MLRALLRNHGCLINNGNKQQWIIIAPGIRREPVTNDFELHIQWQKTLLDGVRITIHYISRRPFGRLSRQFIATKCFQKSHVKWSAQTPEVWFFYPQAQKYLYNFSSCFGLVPKWFGIKFRKTLGIKQKRIFHSQGLVSAYLFTNCIVKPEQSMFF